MKYVVFNKKDNSVDKIYDNKPREITSNLDIALCKEIIKTPQYGFLKVIDLEKITEEYTIPVNKLNKETGEIERGEETKIREYQICKLAAVESANKDKLIQIQNTKKLIKEKKALLEKYKYDVQQVDLFGMERTDYEEKKAACAALVLELRELEKSIK